jgi:hypothetical protein
MRLTSAAGFFDRQPVYDGYSGLPLFTAQFSAFDDNNAVGSTAVRRVLSVVPGTVIPDHKVLNIAGETWIVGDGISDLWGPDPIRVSYNIKKASDLMTVGTPAQVLLSQPGALQVYGQKLYFNEVSASMVSSDSLVAWNIFFAATVEVKRGYLVVAAGEVFRISEAYIPVDRLMNTKAVRLSADVPSAVLQKAVFSPVSDSTAYSESIGFLAFMPGQLLYENSDGGAPKLETGDLSALYVTVTTPPEAGDRLLIPTSGAVYQIFNARPELDAFRVLLKKL